MRIVFWASTFGHTIGGGPVLAPLLAGALQSRGHDVLAITDQRPTSLPEEEEIGGVRVLRFPFRRALAGDVRLFASLRRRVAELKRDLNPNLSYIFSSGYCELFHHETEDVVPAPLVVTLHDSFAAERLRSSALVGRNLRAASWVTACSAFVLDHARRHVPEITATSSAILNAVPAPNRDPVSPSADPAHLLYVGRLVHKKGVDVLLAAFAMLTGRFPELRLTIVGGGDDAPELKMMASRLGVAELATFAGSLGRDDIFDLMATAGMVVMPSRIEPFGLVALEAAHMGRPVVASSVDGLPEVVLHGQTGLLVPPDDAPALADAIASLVDDPERARVLGERARARALEAFTWEGFVDSYERLFEAVARP